VVARLGTPGRVMNFVLDLATFGFNSSYAEAIDDRSNGVSSESEAHRAKVHAAVRTAAIAVVSTITGGLAEGAISGRAGVSTARAIAGGAAGGSVGGAYSLVTSDAYNNYIAGTQSGTSSPQAYVETILMGGAGGAALAGVARGLSRASSAYLPTADEHLPPINDGVSKLDGKRVEEEVPQTQAAEPSTQSQVEYGPAPSFDQIKAMERADVGSSLKMAQEFVKNPNTTYHHYLMKGGLREIVGSSTFRGGDGTASFGGALSVRAWIGEVAPGASVRAQVPVIEFTTVSGEVPNTRLYQSRPGAYWKTESLPVRIKTIYLPDGSIAVPDGEVFKLTRADGTTSRIAAKELPE